jgi:hypothetical protein
MAQGRLYETQLHARFKETVAPCVTVFPQAGGHGIDLEFQHTKYPKPVGTEIKLNVTDTMGGSSLRFSESTLSSVPVKPVPGFDAVFPAIQARITLALQDYVRRANELIVLHNTTSPEKYAPITGFPAKIPVEVRKQCKKEGFQQRIQSMYDSTIDTWKAFYRAKGNSYIQIGGKGLFHLGENPLDLPVPEITGSISFEVRLYAAGTGGKPYARVEIALKFKKLTCEKSPYTLDNKEHIAELFKE